MNANGNSPIMEIIIDAIAHSSKLKPSRHSSIVKTKLEEAYLWMKDLEDSYGVELTDISN